MADFPDWQRPSDVMVGPALVNEDGLANGATRGPFTLGAFAYLALVCQVVGAGDGRLTASFGESTGTNPQNPLSVIDVRRALLPGWYWLPVVNDRVTFTFNLAGGALFRCTCKPVAQRGLYPGTGSGYELLFATTAIAGGAAQQYFVQPYTGRSTVTVQTPAALVATVLVEALDFNGNVIGTLASYAVAAATIDTRELNLPPHVIRVTVTNTGGVLGSFTTTVTAMLDNSL